MGRPRALKNRDVVPAVKIDISSTKGKKRTNFDDEDEVNIQVIEEIANHQEEHEVVHSEEEEPEEVKANSYEVLQLKEKLESSLSRSKRDRKKKKTRVEEGLSRADELLDTSILDGMNAEEEDDKGVPSSGGFQMKVEVVKEDSKPRLNKKYIGNFEISVLEKDSINPFENFQVSKDVQEFSNRRKGDVQRVKYTTFMSQKRPTAASSFRKRK